VKRAILVRMISSLLTCDDLIIFYHCFCEHVRPMNASQTRKKPDTARICAAGGALVSSQAESHFQIFTLKGMGPALSLFRTFLVFFVWKWRILLRFCCMMPVNWGKVPDILALGMHLPPPHS